MAWSLTTEGIERTWDVLVVGGGIAGLATALNLRRRLALGVLVVEPGDQPTERFGETVPPDILPLLDHLGLGDRFGADGHLPCPGSVSLWGGETPGHNDFILSPMGPAWHLSRARFESMLRRAAVEAGATLRTRTRCVSAAPVDGGWTVGVRDGTGVERTVQAAWVVDATGSGARFARHCGAVRRVHDRMHAIVGFFHLAAGSLSAQTVVEATPHGWWYCARLPGDWVVTVLLAERSAARALTRDGHVRWRELLRSTALLGPRLAGCRFDEERFGSHRVESALLDHVEGHRWLAVGDAAATFDPIASQGIHKAFCDAADAAVSMGGALGVNAPPPWRYRDRVKARFDDYQATRDYLYGLEKRWPDADFWRSRQPWRSPGDVAGGGVR